MSRTGLAALLFGVAIAIGACGGGSGSTAPSGGASPSAAASAGASPSAAATQGGASPSTPASAAPSSAGGGASAACDLLTAQEAADVLDYPGTVAEATPGEPSYCMYKDITGAAVLATSYGKSGGGAVFAVYQGEDGATAVEGIGDGAVFSPSTDTLFILKGDAIVGITAGRAGTEPADRLELSKKVGAIVAGRM